MSLMDDIQFPHDEPFKERGCYTCEKYVVFPYDERGTDYCLELEMMIDPMNPECKLERGLDENRV